jgi:DNA-binding MarR family transcriptional regulator
MVGRLMEAGYVDRAPSATDGRAWTVSLTATGQAALETFRVNLDAMNAEITAALGGEAEVVRFAESLRALLAIAPARDG